MQKLKHLDGDFEIADGVYIGLIFPEERHFILAVGSCRKEFGLYWCCYTTGLTLGL